MNLKPTAVHFIFVRVIFVANSKLYTYVDNADVMETSSISYLKITFCMIGVWYGLTLRHTSCMKQGNNTIFQLA